MLSLPLKDADGHRGLSPPLCFYQEAVAAYERAIEIDPGQFVAHFNLGVVYGKVRRYEEELIEFGWFPWEIDM